jgi:hypothetical protein
MTFNCHKPSGKKVHNGHGANFDGLGGAGSIDLTTLISLPEAGEKEGVSGGDVAC